MGRKEIGHSGTLLTLPPHDTLQLQDLIEFLADSHGDLTEALDLVLTGDGKPYVKGEGPNKALGFREPTPTLSPSFFPHQAT